MSRKKAVGCYFRFVLALLRAPDGWVAIADLAREAGVSRWTAERLLEDLEELELPIERRAMRDGGGVRCRDRIVSRSFFEFVERLERGPGGEGRVRNH